MTEDDYGYMLEWRQDDDVKRFYSNPHDNYTLEKVVRKYASRVQGKDKKKPIIILFHDIPVGYLQFYELDREDKRLYGFPETYLTFGMDILIGNKSYRNKGIASQAIKLIQKYLKENTKVNNMVLKLANETQVQFAVTRSAGLEKYWMLQRVSSLWNFHKERIR